MTHKVIFDGFDTLEQAEEFSNWYAGSGEQDSEVWLQEHTDLEGAVASAMLSYKDVVTVYLDLYYKENE